ncbi:hypothetical protein D521_0313 [beta proteobacterium CB]|nr:hypothetical protein D521_0313 [beta proteobacterium CB]
MHSLNGLNATEIETLVIYLTSNQQSQNSRVVNAQINSTRRKKTAPNKKLE